jgi:hypothetical protein
LYARYARMWVNPSQAPDGSRVPDPHACRQNDYVHWFAYRFLAEIAYNVAVWDLYSVKGEYHLRGVQPPNVPKDDGTIGKPEAILRYTSGGTSVYEAVRLYGVSTIPHRNIISHPARTGPDFMTQHLISSAHKNLFYERVNTVTNMTQIKITAGVSSPRLI